MGYYGETVKEQAQISAMYDNPETRMLAIMWCSAEPEYLPEAVVEYINEMVAAFASGDCAEQHPIYTYTPTREDDSFNELDIDFGLDNFDRYVEMMELLLGGEKWDLPEPTEMRRRVNRYARYVMHSFFSPELITIPFSDDIEMSYWDHKSLHAEPIQSDKNWVVSWVPLRVWECQLRSGEMKEVFIMQFCRERIGCEE